MRTNLLTAGINLWRAPENARVQEIIEKLTALMGESTQLYLFDFTKEARVVHYFRSSDCTENIKKIQARVPEICKTTCRHCGKCARYCEGKALQRNAATGKMMLNTDRCNDCGKCYLICNIKGVLTPVMKTLGQWQQLESGKILVYYAGLRKMLHYRKGIENEWAALPATARLVIICDEEKVQRLLQRYVVRQIDKS